MADAGNEAVKKASGGRCPKCGAMIDYLDYWEKAVNSGEYWPDGFLSPILLQYRDGLLQDPIPLHGPLQV
jgi:hypothetical protein